MLINERILLDAADKGVIPDHLIRLGIRHLLRQRLADIHESDIEQCAQDKMNFVAAMQQSAIALATREANEQHYELPTEFFQLILGSHMKYSSCYWHSAAKNLDEASAAALTQVCERAELKDGQTILELGCGWGSLTLWMAECYPAARITAVSNSASQKAFIDQRAAEKKLANIEVVTCDMNIFDASHHSYDRVVSVEMFEHMRNHGELYRRIGCWLKADGKFFKHIFVHRDAPYLFEDNNDNDWMSRFFFSGGMMPSDDLPHWHQQHLQLQKQWRLNGNHYRKTASAWLANMDSQKNLIMPILASTYGAKNAALWWQRWRIFFISLEELFGFNNGQTWWVSHYLFENRNADSI